MSSAADVFMKAWSEKHWISNPAEYPPAPGNVADLYEVFLAIERHPLAEQFGGLGGYKMGAIGAEGEPCIYAPLFKHFLVDAASGPANISVDLYQLFMLEAEIGVIMGADLPSRPDGKPHSQQDVWAAVESVRPCIECCGRRASPDVVGGLNSALAKMADCLSAGGVVFGAACDPQGVASWSASSSMLEVAGQTVTEGSGAACPLGGPQEALTYLANHLNSRGLSLKKGQLIITGMTCKSPDFAAGDKIAASFSTLGRVEMNAIS
eukprot:TRINITY_DN92539_c0_g1_i1.p1 TRINITY_DN92539_c0_g1~~TRINITY_DN92539_c0_g1_i1.p1  ORF type:complete len:265 (+),score=30.73 TRINITY_DN92539_c0_g1_i1:66-860(+)